MQFSVEVVKTKEPDVYVLVGIVHNPTGLRWDLELDKDDWAKLKPYLPKELQEAKVKE